ncbi:MAG TPA: multiheme c-type cytochrome [Gemmataceae bacterium]|nr:multiheme c-type cytochrome [Gemmataceae bacterium]
MNRPNDEPNKETTSPPATAPRTVALAQGVKFLLAAVILTVVSVLTATGLARRLKAPAPEEKKAEGTGIPARLFAGWDKPDLVILLSAQQHGYMMPCGCSYPQVGGLERRYNFLQMLKARGWPVVAVDLGDVPQKRGPANLPNVQGLIKYRYSMKALDAMGYLGVGAGEYEAALSLGRVEGEWAANSQTPAVLVGNLKEPDNFPFLKPTETRTVPGANIKVGVTSVVGPSVAENIKDPSVKFAVQPPKGVAQVLPEQLKKMQGEKVDLPILLYHGLVTPRKGDGVKEALRCAEAFPQFPVIVCLSEEDEPPANPNFVDHPQTGTRNYVFRLGHKGKHVGVLGVWRTGQANAPFKYKYQLVEMGVEYVTPEGKEAENPIGRMMEEYTRELKKDNYLARYGQSSHIVQAMNPVAKLRNPGDGVPTYVGSAACKKCHEEAFEVWKGSDHSHAYKTLVDAKHPSLTQYDGECIVCHTVGFGYKTGFTDEIKTQHLENVGCESCHGPASLHVKNPNDVEWQARMNQPWRGPKEKGNIKAKNLAIDKFCQSCHDIDNDVNWIHGAFERKWKKIVHPKP